MPGCELVRLILTIKLRLWL